MGAVLQARAGAAMMRVLMVAEFDPCQFGQHLRGALLSYDVDMRLAVQRLYWRGCDPHWWLDSTTVDHGSLYEFAHTADVIILCPCIGQPWSYTPPFVFHAHPEPDECHMGGINWDSMPGKRLALFHGSTLLSAHAERYAELYRDRGYAIGATTLDYVLRMRALYFPPAVFLPNERARYRANDEGLHVIHSPTAPSLCQTAEFEGIVKAGGFEPCGASRPELDSYGLYSGVAHDALIREKARYNCGFDHVRGCFSINSVENAGMGLVNLVGIVPEAHEWLSANMRMHLPWPRIETMGDVAEWLERLREDPALTRDLQKKGNVWFEDRFCPDSIGKWVAQQLAAIVG